MHVRVRRLLFFVPTEKGVFVPPLVHSLIRFAFLLMFFSVSFSRAGRVASYYDMSNTGCG